MTRNRQSLKASIVSVGRIIKTRLTLISVRSKVVPTFVICLVAAALVAAVITSAATPSSNHGNSRLTKEELRIGRNCHQPSLQPNLNPDSIRAQVFLNQQSISFGF